MKELPWVACVSKENYDNFCRVFSESALYREGKKIVIFGAGIMGLQFSYSLRELGVKELLFCDNDSNKWGKEVGGIKVISTSELKGQSDEYFIFLAMERYEVCVEQLIHWGYQEKTAWEKVINCSENKFVKDFLKDNKANTLILGDCAATTVSIFESDKQPLTELLYRKDKVKVMALNSLYMRTYYNLLLLNLERMNELKKVILLLDLSIFQEKYSLLPKNQHVAVMKELAEISKKDIEEVQSFIQESRKRAESQSIFGAVSPNRTDLLSDERLEQERKLHMRLNTLYRFKEDTESVKYLDLFVSKCSNQNIDVIVFLLPVNYELGVKYFGNLFFDTYEITRDAIKQHIELAGGKIVDGSYVLKNDEFLSLRSANEGLTAVGRRKIADMLNEYNNFSESQ